MNLVSKGKCEWRQHDWVWKLQWDSFSLAVFSIWSSSFEPQNTKKMPTFSKPKRQMVMLTSASNFYVLFTPRWNCCSKTRKPRMAENSVSKPEFACQSEKNRSFPLASSRFWDLPPCAGENFGSDWRLGLERVKEGEERRGRRGESLKQDIDIMQSSIGSGGALLLFRYWY